LELPELRERLLELLLFDPPRELFELLLLDPPLPEEPLDDFLSIKIILKFPPTRLAFRLSLLTLFCKYSCQDFQDVPFI